MKLPRIRLSASKRGYGSRWRAARAAYLRKHPLCVKCAEKGRHALAAVVDHIIPHKGDKSLFWDSSNWQPLCYNCHDVDKRREERKIREIGLDGWPVPS